MKNTILVLLLLIFVLLNINICAQNQLNKILGNGYTQFVDENNGWVFDEYHIRKTTDGGSSWEIMLTFNNELENLYTSSLNDLIFFVNSQTGYFITPRYYGLSNSSHLYKTTNGGISFTRSTIVGSNFNIDSYARNLFFINENIGWFVSDAKELIKTTNGGQTWQQIYVAPSAIEKIHFTDQLKGFAYFNYKLNYTNDGGITWIEANVPSNNATCAISTIGNNVWFGGYNYGIYYSNNNGIDWTKISESFPSGPQTWSLGYLKMFSLTHGVSNGHITTDGGITWTEKFNRYNSYKTVSFVDINNCWFHDANGNLKKTNDFFETQKTVFHITTSSIGTLPFSSVKIVSDQVVVATFKNGGIIRSSDGGKSWKFIDDLFTVQQINDISFANSTTGIAVGKNYISTIYDSAYISRTTDAGQTWNVVYKLPGVPGLYTEDILSVSFSNGIFIAKSNGKILRSTNLGLNWSADSTDLFWGLNQIQFIGNTGFGISPGGTARLHKTTNQGTGWSVINNDKMCSGSLNFISENLIYVSFADSFFCKSIDGGNTWTKTGWTPDWDHKRFFFKNNLIGVASGHNLSFGQGTFITENSGNSWTKISEKYDIINVIENGIDFHSSENGYIATAYGLFTLKKFGSIDSVTAVEDELNINPNNFVLHQNYPNPFNPSTVISYQLPAFSKVNLKVYDILGNEIAVLVDEYKSPGIYKVEWNASGFASGVYFYRLYSWEFSSVKKLILMR
jgi:photosystem II stability/assembly factor-like uncharacterized protein